MCGGPNNKSFVPSKCTLASTQYTLRWLPLESAHQVQIAPSPMAKLLPSLLCVTSPGDILWACVQRESGPHKKQSQRLFVPMSPQLPLSKHRKGEKRPCSQFGCSAQPASLPRSKCLGVTWKPLSFRRIGV